MCLLSLFEGEEIRVCLLPTLNEHSGIHQQRLPYLESEQGYPSLIGWLLFFTLLTLSSFSTK